MPAPLLAGATGAIRPAAALLPMAALVAALAASQACAQEQLVRAPLPPERPFDLDLPVQPPLSPPASTQPGASLPASAAATTAPASITIPPAAAAPEAKPDGPDSPAAGEPEEDEGPAWPQLTPGQKAGAEPQFDPDEKPERPGISTDPGTSIACLPQVLKGILNKIVDKYGAVKVTSTWRPPWRARRGSYHKRCEAMDFRVPGVRPRAVLDYARSLSEVGGNQLYWNGLIHVDTGPRRPW